MLEFDQSESNKAMWLNSIINIRINYKVLYMNQYMKIKRETRLEKV